MTEPIEGRRTPDRHWIAQLYYYVAALIGLAFVITGSVMFVLGVKQAALPGLGQRDYACDRYYLGNDLRCSESEQERQEQRDRENRREDGLDGALNGLLIGGIGAPVLVWHLRQTRQKREFSDKS